MVVVTASHDVVPREPTPSSPLEIRGVDQIHRFHISTIFVYKQDKQSGMRIQVPVEKIKDSLSHMLVYYYPLAGRLRRTEDDKLEVDCNGKGATLLEATSEAELTGYGDFAPSQLVEDLVPKVDYSTPIENWPLLLVQVTTFGCGGVCLGVCICHNLVDAWSKFYFVKSWAKLFRVGALDKDEIPIHDRSILKPKIPNIQTPHFDHEEYGPLPLLLGRSDAREEQQNETTSIMLHLRKEQIDMLKKEANRVNIDADKTGHRARPYSSYEVIAAHIWRCACKARQFGNDTKQPTLIRLAASVRNRLNPPIPDNYAGNAVVVTRTPICVFGDIISNPLGYSAQMMRQAAAKVTVERIRSTIDMLDRNDNDIPKVGSSRTYFTGNPNLNIGCVSSIPMYGADFGWGKPFYAGPTSLEADGKTFILPTRFGDGSVNIAIRLQTRHAESFKKYFFDDFN